MFLWSGVLVCSLSAIVLLLIMVISEKIYEDEYLSVYECGFDSSYEARVWFSYRFFLMGVLFIVFDVEISFLLSIPYMNGGYIFLLLFIVFIGVLLGGTLYEIELGSMDWV